MTNSPDQLNRSSVARPRVVTIAGVDTAAIAGWRGRPGRVVPEYFDEPGEVVADRGRVE
jgi:hypothetical protein